jgi:serine/threonine protein kinase
MEIVVGSKYKICKKLGKGSFGVLYSGINLKTEEEVAIKLEKVSEPQPILHYESKIYEKLAGVPGVPNVHWYGIEGDYSVMVIDILGPTLEKLFEFCQYKWSMQVILWIAEQLVSRIESLHSKNFIHRDIKTENFLIGYGKK